MLTHVEANEYSYKGCQVIIDYDDYPHNPREDCNLGTMVCFHNRYSLGDIKVQSGDIDQYSRISNSSDYIALPLFLYDHSGITMNTTGFSCPWDSGQVGWIYVSRFDVYKEYGVERVSAKLRKRVEDILRAEVAEYDASISGEVYYYNIMMPSGEEDSCGGFYDRDYCKESAVEHVDYWLKQGVAA